MQSCIRCGKTLEGFDIGGDMVCMDCESAGGVGGAGNVPCQRCGMYLPSHELQMWHSRLYCAYCIMDIRDEERYGKHGSRDYGGKSGDTLSGEHGIGKGTCERCGKYTDGLYSFHGRRLCSGCFHDSQAQGGSSSPSLFGSLISGIKKIVQPQSKVIPNQRISVPAPLPLEKREVFDVKSRTLVQRGEKEKLPEILDGGPQEKKKERKASGKSKKGFFKLHSAIKPRKR